MPDASRAKIDVPFADDADVRAMVVAFEACRWPYARWTHRAHLGVAACYLRDYPFAEAVARVRRHIPLYNAASGGDPNGYHDTITVLFMRGMHHFLRTHPAVMLTEAVEEMARRCDMTWPLRYYSHERLWSPEARAGWVEPDREPLNF